MTDFLFDRLPSRAADIETRTASEVLDEIEAGHRVFRRVANFVALSFLFVVIGIALLAMGPAS